MSSEQLVTFVCRNKLTHSTSTCFLFDWRNVKKREMKKNEVAKTKVKWPHSARQKRMTKWKREWEKRRRIVKWPLLILFFPCSNRNKVESLSLERVFIFCIHVGFGHCSSHVFGICMRSFLRFFLLFFQCWKALNFMCQTDTPFIFISGPSNRTLHLKNSWPNRSLRKTWRRLRLNVSVCVSVSSSLLHTQFIADRPLSEWDVSVYVNFLDLLLSRH